MEQKRKIEIGSQVYLEEGGDPCGGGLTRPDRNLSLNPSLRASIVARTTVTSVRTPVLSWIAPTLQEVFLPMHLLMH